MAMRYKGRSKRPTTKFKYRRKTSKPRRRRRLLTSPIRLAPGGINFNAASAADLMEKASKGGLNLESEVMSMAKEQLMKAAGQAVDASDLGTMPKTAAKLAAAYAVKKLSEGTRVNSPPRMTQETPPVFSSASLEVQNKPLNNSIVPDKKLTFHFSQGKMSKREEPFYKKWPLQNVSIYRSQNVDTIVHTASPGTKSFYAPFYNTSLNGTSPNYTDVNDYRLGVEMTDINPTFPSYPPSFLPTSTEFGTVVGGQDYQDNLHLWGWADQMSCISALTDRNFSLLAGQARQSESSLKFGIDSMTLEFHIENSNKYFPAEFTIQQWKRKGASTEASSTEYPTSLIFDQSSGIPLHQRAYVNTSTIDVAGISVGYTSELSVRHNSSTFANNKKFQQCFMNLATRKVRLTAGGRLKVRVVVNYPPVDFVDYANISPDSQPSGTIVAPCFDQIFTTIVAKGTQECTLNTYFQGNPTGNSAVATNPVYYTVSNIQKSAKVYAPNLNIRTAGTSGFQQVNPVYQEFVNSMQAFGENRTKQFVPDGDVRAIYDQAQLDDIPPVGFSYTIPILTNQQTDSAFYRR